MNDTSRILTIIAYYLSEYDLKAVHKLGYKSRTEAFNSISSLAGRDNNYLKLRRDEFDALPTSSSSRKGFRNRPPAKVVQEYAEYLSKFSYVPFITPDELGDDFDWALLEKLVT